jgi:peptidyl-prolyl cis-trans isomerase C
MTFFRGLLFVCPLAAVLAQTPPRPAQASPAPQPATPSASKPAEGSQAAQPAKPAQPPQPTVTMSAENMGSAPMPVLPPDKVVITVGDQKITYAEFDAIINSLPEQYRASARGPVRAQFAQSLVRAMVLADEGKRRKIDQTDAYKMVAAFQMRNILAGMVAEQIQKDVKVDDAALHAYYDAHKAEFEQVHALHILIRMQGSPVPVRAGQKDLTDAEALAKAQDLRKKLQGGADFGNLAIEESDDTGSGAKGGDLGTFHHQQMVPAFEQAAFALKVGELSEPVKTQFGYHIIKVVSHDNKSFEEMRPDLEKRLRPELSQKYLEELVQKSTVTLDPELFAAPPAQSKTVPLAIPAPAK